MADMMSTLKGFLGDNADEKIKGAMEMLKSSGMLDSGNENLGNQIENSISAYRSYTVIQFDESHLLILCSDILGKSVFDFFVIWI